MQIEEGHFKNPKGLDLAYRLMLPYETESGDSEKHPVVILVHGFGGSINSAYIKRSLHKVTECGAAAFSFNFTNMGKGRVDTSQLTPENALQDLYTAMEFIKAHPRVDASRIIAVGASFGAYTLLRYEAEAQDEALKALVLHSVVPVPLKPFDRLLTPVRIRFWRMLGHIVQEIDGFKCRISYKIYDECSRINILQDVAPKIRKPVTLVHGDCDFLASLDDVKDLEKALIRSPKVQTYVMHGAEHEFGYVPRMGELYSDFEKAVMYVQNVIRSTFYDPDLVLEKVEAEEPNMLEKLQTALKSWVNSNA